MMVPSLNIITGSCDAIEDRPRCCWPKDVVQPGGFYVGCKFLKGLSNSFVLQLSEDGANVFCW